VTPRIDLSHAEVVDDHVHAFRLGDVRARDLDGFEASLTLMGTCFSSSSRSDPALWDEVRAQAPSSVFVLTARRWLSERLGCDPSAEAVTAARTAAVAADDYVPELLADQRIVGLITDEGYPQPPIPREEFEGEAGVPVHRVARIEPWIASLLPACERFEDLEQGFGDRLESAAADARLVAFKSIIAYRTGLDVEPVASADAATAFDRWRSDGFRESREHAKPVRDFLLHRTLDAARLHGLAMHIHCGDGDPDVVLGRSRPQDLFPLLRERMDQPIVLIHGGHPWSAEAGYIASLLPNVYVDLSVLVPWAASAIDQLLEVLLGLVPTSKLLYASDEASEPEVLWIAAKMARAALERVLSDAVDRDHLTVPEAVAIGEGVLAGNARRLHGLTR